MHLRVEESAAAENDLIQNLLNAAVDYAARYIGRGIPWDDESGDTAELPASLNAAILLIVSDLYENREAQIVGKTISANPAVDRLLHFHRIDMGI